jgi:hypothetical protein
MIMSPRTTTIYAGDYFNGISPRLTKEQQHPGYLQGMNNNRLELVELHFIHHRRRFRPS